MERSSLDDMLAGIPSQLLDQKITSDIHLADLAKLLVGWKEARSYLGLTEVEEETIWRDHPSQPEQRLAFLQIWRNKYYPTATYRNLAKCFYNAGNDKMVTAICEILQPLVNPPSTPPSNPPSNTQAQPLYKEDIPVQVSITDDKPQSGLREHEGSEEGSTDTGLTSVLSIQPPFQQLSFSEQEELKEMLYDDVRKMKRLFGSLVSATCDSIEEQIPVVNFARHILALGAYDPAPGERDRSLLDEHRQEIKGAKSISEIFIILNAYWNYLNYEVLEYIIEHYGTSEDTERLRKYKERLHDFCKRRIFELPMPVRGNGTENKLSPKQEKLHVKLDVQKDIPSEQFNQIKGKIAKILHVRPATLQICSIAEGCVQLTFLIPKFVAHEIFPLSREQTTALSKDASVIGLECMDVFEYSRSSAWCPRRMTSNSNVKLSGLTQEGSHPALDGVELCSKEDHGFAFHFTLPPDGLALRSVAIVDDVPEIRFDASHKVPTITEEDVAIALRLALEGNRPEFFFIPIPFGHPFYGRQFNQYKPQWLRETSVGKLLFDADWNMKCLSVGARSNDEKSVFWGWQKTSQLEDVATMLDFPQDKPFGSIIMSCESAKVQKDENEMVFPEEPKMRIVHDSNSLYSKYITDIYPSIAYYDEPCFLKMQELIKLILAAEWLTEKGVKVSRKWMMGYTAKPRQVAKAIKRAKSHQDKVRSPEMIPSQPATVQVLTSDVILVAEECRRLGKCVGYRYGWHDFRNKEMVMFDEDGALCLRQQSLNMVVNKHVTMEGQPTEEVSLWLSCPLPLNTPMTEFGDVMEQCKQVSQFTGVFGHLLAQCKEKTFIKASVNNYDLLYDHMDPNQPIRQGIPGWCEKITPSVKSWNELFRETVPWPHVWQVPYLGVGMPVASGGVTTCDIPTTVSSIASSFDSQLAVQAQWQAAKQIFEQVRSAVQHDVEVL